VYKLSASDGSLLKYLYSDVDILQRIGLSLSETFLIVGS